MLNCVKDWWEFLLFFELLSIFAVDWLHAGVPL